MAQFGATADQALAAFRNLDTNGTGELSVDQLERLFTSMDADGIALFSSLYSPHLTASRLVSADFVSSELNALRLVAGAANWVGSRRTTTECAVAATNRSARAVQDVKI